MKSKAVKAGLYFACGLLLICVAIFAGDSMTSAGSGSGEQIVEVALGEAGTVGGGKYRTWYTGYADGAPWCATFISWCAEQCGLIDSEVIPKFEGCNWGISWFKERGLFSYTQHYGGEDYAPKTGDIIFFSKYYSKYNSSHVGIVQYVENGYVVTIEGNTTNSVAPRSYSLDDPFIIGYATPNYPIGGNFSGNTNAEIAWNFFISKGCNEYAAAGILGNLQQESTGIVPTMAQSGGGPGRGIGQWEIYSNRWYGLCDYAERQGKDWTDLNIQLQYIWYELSGGESTCVKILNRNYGGLTGLKNATSIEWAVEAFEKSFERAGTPFMSNRIQYAYEFYNSFAKGD